MERKSLGSCLSLLGGALLVIFVLLAVVQGSVSILFSSTSEKRALGILAAVALGCMLVGGIMGLRDKDKKL